ncbi:hypothetical protein LV779_15610 [Streptomyces thinghirensis]|nr:hypothetical protein [Streptomyces thinghirensis]
MSRTVAKSPTSPVPGEPGRHRRRGHPARHLATTDIVDRLGQHGLGYGPVRLSPVQPRRARAGLPAWHPAPDDPGWRRGPPNSLTLKAAGRAPRSRPPSPCGMGSPSRRSGRRWRQSAGPVGSRTSCWRSRPRARCAAARLGDRRAPNWHNDSFPGRSSRAHAGRASLGFSPTVQVARRGTVVTVGEARWSRGARPCRAEPDGCRPAV